MMETTIREFEPVPNTQTHVLVDSWFGCKRIWKAARDRGFLITSGLKCNRSLGIADPQAEGGKRWQRLDEYAASGRIAAVVNIVVVAIFAVDAFIVALWYFIAGAASFLITGYAAGLLIVIWRRDK